MVYIIIGRHAYRDTRALYTQLAMYVLKYLYIIAFYILKLQRIPPMNFTKPWLWLL